MHFLLGSNIKQGCCVNIYFKLLLILCAIFISGCKVDVQDSFNHVIESPVVEPPVVEPPVVEPPVIEPPVIEPPVVEPPVVEPPVVEPPVVEPPVVEPPVVEPPIVGNLKLLMSGNYYAYLNNDYVMSNASGYEEVQDALESDVINIFNAGHAYLVLKNDGSVVTFGYHSNLPNNSELNNVSEVVTTDGAFAVLKVDGTVLTWGSSYALGNAASINHLLVNVIKVISNNGAFAALKSDGTVVTWGQSDHGGFDSMFLDEIDIKHLAPSDDGYGFIYIESDGEYAHLSSYGGVFDSQYIGDLEINTSDNIFIKYAPYYSNQITYLINGYVTSNNYGYEEVQDALESDVINIFNAGHAYLVLKNDGSVVTFGYHSNLPNNSELNNVSEVVTTDGAFAVLKVDGTVLTWGSSYALGNAASINHLLVNVIKVISNNGAFAALKSDGSVVTWGQSNYGGFDYAYLTDIKDIASSSDGGFIYIDSNGEYIHTSSYGSFSSFYIGDSEINIDNGQCVDSNCIENAVSITNINGLLASNSIYKIYIPENIQTLSISISGGSGDADLYVNYDSEPSDIEYTCRPYIGGNEEECHMENPESGIWYIGIKGYSSYSDVQLLANFQ